jgi:hypothetical protein
MAHICGFCSNCMAKVLLQPGAANVEVRDVIATNDACCSCDLRMPHIWAALRADAVVTTLVGAGPLAIKHHGVLQVTRGTRRS